MAPLEQLLYRPLPPTLPERKEEMLWKFSPVQRCPHRNPRTSPDFRPLSAEKKKKTLVFFSFFSKKKIFSSPFSVLAAVSGRWAGLVQLQAGGSKGRASRSEGRGGMCFFCLWGVCRRGGRSCCVGFIVEDVGYALIGWILSFGRSGFRIIVSWYGGNYV